MPTENRLRLTVHCTESVQTQEPELPELIREAGLATRLECPANQMISFRGSDGLWSLAR